MSLCVFTFNSFCRRPRAAHSSSHSSIQHNIKRNPGAPCLAPLTLLLLSEVGRRRVEGRWVNNERARQEKRRSFANFSTFLPCSLRHQHLLFHHRSMSLLRLSPSFFPPVHPRAPTLTRLRMDRNSEKLIFLRRPPSPPPPPVRSSRARVSASTSRTLPRICIYRGCTAHRSYGEEGRECVRE